MAEALDLDRLPARGFATSRADFARWANERGERRLLMEDFYRDARERLDVLMAEGEPVTGQWNYDADNRAAAAQTPGDPRRSLTPGGRTRTRSTHEVRADLDAWAADGVEFVGRGRAAAVRRHPGRGAGRAGVISSSTGCRPSAVTRTPC